MCKEMKIHLSIHALNFVCTVRPPLISSILFLLLSFALTLFFIRCSFLSSFIRKCDTKRQTKMNVQTWIDSHLNLHFLVFILAFRWGNKTIEMLPSDTNTAVKGNFSKNQLLYAYRMNDWLHYFRVSCLFFGCCFCQRIFFPIGYKGISFLVLDKKKKKYPPI